MLRRTLFSITLVGAALARRLRGQSRAELNRMAEAQLASTPHQSAEIMKMSSADLIAVLKDADSTEFEKSKACQRLSVVGDASAVPVLAPLLGEAKLSHYARTALETIPGAAVNQALRDALESLDGTLLIGVVNSIGVRRDSEAITALAKLRHGGDARVALAATAAINRIRRP